LPNHPRPFQGTHFSFGFGLGCWQPELVATLTRGYLAISETGGKNARKELDENEHLTLTLSFSLGSLR
jgi:hypothetical protein